MRVPSGADRKPSILGVILFESLNERRTLQPAGFVGRQTQVVIPPPFRGHQHHQPPLACAWYFPLTRPFKLNMCFVSCLGRSFRFPFQCAQVRSLSRAVVSFRGCPIRGCCSRARRTHRRASSRASPGSPGPIGFDGGRVRTRPLQAVWMCVADMKRVLNDHSTNRVAQAINYTRRTAEYSQKAHPTVS